jgi:hypothetical protein
MKYTKNSSLFIFHKDWQIRKFCQQLAETPEVVQELETLQEQGALDNYRQGKDAEKQGGAEKPPNPAPIRAPDKKFKKGIN